MNWESLKEGFELIALGMLGTVVFGVVATFIRHRYFRSRAADEYTYILRSKGGKKTCVELPPDLPEAEQQARMRRAYEELDLPPMDHYPVPMPGGEANLWRLRRHTTKAFRNGETQAISIPSEIAYSRPDIDLEIQRIGDELRIRPAQGN
nr:hypothetical protein [uncultured Duganella sp.]